MNDFFQVRSKSKKWKPDPDELGDSSITVRVILAALRKLQYIEAGAQENDPETDPIFGASEAANFVAGDKAKLDGIETGAQVNKGLIVFDVGGVLAVATDVRRFIVPEPASNSTWYFGLKTPGTAGSTIADIHLFNDTYPAGITIFTTQANRPTVAYNDANGWAVATSDITDFAAGDVLVFEIDQVATGAADAVCVGGAVGGGGGAAVDAVVVQVVPTQSGDVASGAALIPWDDTIPQNTEGWELTALNTAITPTDVNNYLDFDANIFVSPSNGNWVFAALFQDAVAGALAVTAVYITTATAGSVIRLQYRMTAGTVSSTTFKIRLGLYAAGTLTVNGQSTARKFGGVLISSLKITEVKA